MRRLAILLAVPLALSLCGCEIFRGLFDGSGAHQGMKNPLEGAPVASTGSGIDPNLVEEMTAKGVTDQNTGGASEKKMEAGKLETKIVLVDPKDPKSKLPFVACIVSKDWVLIKSEHNSDGTTQWTFIRPACIGVEIDGLGQPGVSTPKPKP